MRNLSITCFILFIFITAVICVQNEKGPSVSGDPKNPGSGPVSENAELYQNERDGGKGNSNATTKSGDSVKPAAAVSGTDKKESKKDDSKKESSKAEVKKVAGDKKAAVKADEKKESDSEKKESKPEDKKAAVAEKKAGDADKKSDDKKAADAGAAKEGKDKKADSKKLV
uniref:Uncharacterized protein n=1 Tax=Panagrolaimus sp. ES5 TaxID=591445 RepID=A0AC34F5Q9_9BILA